MRPYVVAALVAALLGSGLHVAAAPPHKMTARGLPVMVPPALPVGGSSPSSSSSSTLNGVSTSTTTTFTTFTTTASGTPTSEIASASAPTAPVSVPKPILPRQLPIGLPIQNSGSASSSSSGFNGVTTSTTTTFTTFTTTASTSSMTMTSGANTVPAPVGAVAGMIPRKLPVDLPPSLPMTPDVNMVPVPVGAVAGMIPRNLPVDLPPSLPMTPDVNMVPVPVGAVAGMIPRNLPVDLPPSLPMTPDVNMVPVPVGAVAGMIPRQLPTGLPPSLPPSASTSASETSALTATTPLSATSTTTSTLTKTVMEIFPDTSTATPTSTTTATLTGTISVIYPRTPSAVPAEPPIPFAPHLPGGSKVKRLIPLDDGSDGDMNSSNTAVAEVTLESDGNTSDGDTSSDDGTTASDDTATETSTTAEPAPTTGSDIEDCACEEAGTAEDALEALLDEAGNHTTNPPDDVATATDATGETPTISNASIPTDTEAEMEAMMGNTVDFTLGGLRKLFRPNVSVAGANIPDDGTTGTNPSDDMTTAVTETTTTSSDSSSPTGTDVGEEVMGGNTVAFALGGQLFRPDVGGANTPAVDDSNVPADIPVAINPPSMNDASVLDGDDCSEA